MLLSGAPTRTAVESCRPTARPPGRAGPPLRSATALNRPGAEKHGCARRGAGSQLIDGTSLCSRSRGDALARYSSA